MKWQQAIAALSTRGTTSNNNLFYWQVWIGQSGSPKLQRLKSSMGPKGLSPDLFNHNEAFILSIFFDSSGLLQQVRKTALEREVFELHVKWGGG